MRARFREMARACIRHLATSIIFVVAKANKVSGFTGCIGRNVKPCTMTVIIAISGFDA